MRYLIALAILIASSGCYTKKQALRKFCDVSADTVSMVRTIRDSVWVHDSIVVTKGFETLVYLKSPCDSNGKVKPFKQQIKGSNGSVIITNDGDSGITAEVNCDDCEARFSNLNKTYTDLLEKTQSPKDERKWYRKMYDGWISPALQLLGVLTLGTYAFRRLIKRG